MKAKTLIISVILLAVVLAPVAFAHPGEGGRRGPGGFRGRPGAGGPGGFQGRPEHGDTGMLLLGRIADKLGLSEDQRAEIKAIVDGNREEAEEARKAVGEAMKALWQAAAEGSEAEIVAAGKAVGDAMTEQALLRANVWQQIKEVLTEEQLKQLEEMKARMKDRIQHYREGKKGKHCDDGEDGGKRRRGGRRRPRPERQD